MMKNLLAIAFVALLTMGTATAQDYSTSIGLRGGYSNGITLKHFLNENAAVEAIATLRWGGFNITGLYEIHKGRVADVEFLNWYYGAGAHVGVWEGYGWFDDYDSHLVFGLDGIIGLEYTLTEFDIPFSVSLDYKPAFHIGDVGFAGDEFALSVRYIF